MFTVSKGQGNTVNTPARREDKERKGGEKKVQHMVFSTTLLNQQGADSQLVHTVSTAQVNGAMSNDTTQLHYLLSSV